MENNQVLVIGFSTGIRDIESWHFSDDDLCKKFCERLARETGKNVLVIRGELIRKYELDLPVICTEIKPQTTQPKEDARQ